ncbi:MAG: hypothetical protein WAL56_08195 [Candidatus Sulfotelmatobacter sp.]
MRYEDWTFCEAEVRLGDYRELCQALGLSSVPDFTILYRFLQRLDDVTIDRAVGETVRRLRGTHRKRMAARSRGGRCGRLGTGSGQYVLRATDASSRAKTAAVEAWVEVGGRGGSGSTVPAPAASQRQTVDPTSGLALPRSTSHPSLTSDHGCEATTSIAA